MVYLFDHVIGILALLGHPVVIINCWPFHSLFITDMCSAYEYRLPACCCFHFSRLPSQKPLVGCTSHTGFHYHNKCQCQSSVWHQRRSQGRIRWEVWGFQGRMCLEILPILAVQNHFTQISIFLFWHSKQRKQNIKKMQLWGPHEDCHSFIWTRLLSYSVCQIWQLCQWS